MVQHAGAGTAGAGLRAGVSAVPAPFWEGRPAVLGAATEPIPFRSFTAEALAGALGRVVRAVLQPRGSWPPWSGRRAEAQDVGLVQVVATWPRRTRWGWSPTGTDTVFWPVAKSMAVTWSVPLSETTQSLPSPLTVAQ